MSVANKLLDELAQLGATIELSGTQLILRAGTTAIPSELVRRVRTAKSELITLLPVQASERPTEDRIVEWLNQYPAPSFAGQCAWCSGRESEDAIVLPFGTEPGTHTWLHPGCWPAWQAMRRDRAVRELQLSADASS
jgi:hypothetical protein